MESVTALLVDDHPLFRDGFIAAVRHKLPQVDFVVAGTAGEARALERSFDLLLADWRLPDGDGLTLLVEFGNQYPASARVLLSGAEDTQLPARARAAGLVGYLPKTLDPTLLVSAMEQILAGGTFFPGGDAPQTRAVLTARQHSIVSLVARGLSNKEIGRTLDISERTVKDHISLIFARLGAVNRADAIARAATMGLL